MSVEDGTARGATHYQGKGDQPIEIMQNKMTHEQFIGFLRGNVIKYILRIGCKDDDIKDAQKAAQYAKWLCQALNGETINPMKDKSKPEFATWGTKEGELLWDKMNFDVLKRMGNNIGLFSWIKHFTEYPCFIRGEKIETGDIIVYRDQWDIELIKKENKNCSTCGNNINNIDCKANICSMKDGLPRWIPKEI